MEKFMLMFSSICVWSAIVLVLLRILSASGVRLGKNSVISGILADKSLKGGFEVSKKELAAVFGLAALFRFIIFIISIFAIYIFRDKEFTFKDMLDVYLQWDANNYQRIAIGGYKYYAPDGDYTTLVFFPLYPWLIRLFTIVFQDERVSGIILSGLMYAGACCYMYKLMAIDYNKSTAVRALIYISVFPHALFFGVMMNESTLLFTAAATLYYIRKHDWVKVGIFGALAALSRMAGLLMAIPAAVEWLEYYGILDKIGKKKFAEVWRLFYRKGLWIFLMLAGLGIYLWCNYYVTGNFFTFLEYQEKYWSNDLVYFGKSIGLIFNNAVNETKFTRFAIWIPEACSIIFAVVMLFYGLRRQRNMYSAFIIAYLIVNTSMGWPLSVARYMTCAIPLFMALSDFSERHKWTEPIITSSMAVTMGVYYVAYFLSKQVL